MDVLRGLLGSKKGLMAIVATIAAMVASIGWQVDKETLAIILAPVVAYIVGQGIADHGKEATRVASGILSSDSSR